MEFTLRMIVILHVGFWITATLEISNAGSAATCPSMLSDGQATWREVKNRFEIIFNASNVACVLGSNCTLLLSEKFESNATSRSIRIDMQAGDDISMKFEDALNNTYDVMIGEILMGGTNTCYVSGPTLSTTNRTHDFSLDQEILKPGNQTLLVKFSTRELECDLIWRLEIITSQQECTKNKASVLCSGTGYCGVQRDSVSFSCSCCPGYVGKYCEEKDACFTNPCQHGGFCVDIAEGLAGSTYQCLCPHGYRGQSCEGEVSLCDKRPCSNNGSCHGNQTHYTCLCPRGFTGADCDHNINECLSNPCIHGVCEDGVGGYKCYCLPGYGGDHCEFEYDECDSSPCINGGNCEDLVAGYMCHCGPGYKGRRCQIKVDLCTPNPCPSPAQCLDRGNNYSCVCHPGYNSPGCTQHYDPCYPNPCQHGGKCWPSLDSYFCSCPPGFTGDLCEETIYASKAMPRTSEEDVISDMHNVAHEGPVDHWHNVYLAGTMLALAGTLVVLGAIVCHCRTHKTYLAFTRRLSRSCSEIKQQKIEDPGKITLDLRGSVSDRPPESGYEASNVDVSENLDAPLIV